MHRKSDKFIYIVLWHRIIHITSIYNNLYHPKKLPEMLTLLKEHIENGSVFPADDVIRV